MAKKAVKECKPLEHTLENELRANGYAVVCGVDEAGRGPLCGPVVAAACVLPPNVVPWSPGSNARATSSIAAHAPMGNPEATPLAMDTMSGVTPKF